MMKLLHLYFLTGVVPPIRFHFVFQHIQHCKKKPHNASVTITSAAGKISVKKLQLRSMNRYCHHCSVASSTILSSSVRVMI